MGENMMQENPTQVIEEVTTPTTQNIHNPVMQQALRSLPTQPQQQVQQPITQTSELDKYLAEINVLKDENAKRRIAERQAKEQLDLFKRERELQDLDEVERLRLMKEDTEYKLRETEKKVKQSEIQSKVIDKAVKLGFTEPLEVAGFVSAKLMQQTDVEDVDIDQALDKLRNSIARPSSPPVNVGGQIGNNIKQPGPILGNIMGYDKDDIGEEARRYAEQGRPQNALSSAVKKLFTGGQQ